MNKTFGVALVAGLVSVLTACSKQSPTAGAGLQPAGEAEYRSVQPLAVTYGLSSNTDSGIYVNLGYRDKDDVKLGFLPNTGDSSGRIFCPIMLETAISAGEAIEVATVPSENPGLYDDLVLGIRYRGRTCPQ